MSTIKIKNGDGTNVYYNVIGTGVVDDPHQAVIPDYRIPYAIDIIESTYSDTVSVRDKAKSLIKFGANPDLDSGTKEMIWNLGGFETYQTGNTIDEVVSDDASDTQDIVIEGHTLSGSDFSFVSQTVTLNGTTPVTLGTPLARANRMYNNDSTDFAGTITVSVSGSTDHLQAIGDANQSLKCATTISSQDYWIITGLMVSVNRANTAVVDFELQIRESGKVFRTVYAMSSARDSGVVKVDFEQPIIAPKNSDVRIVATSNAANTVVQSAIHGYLASVQ